MRLRQGKARQGKARQGKARQGKARQGKARQGKARQIVRRFVIFVNPPTESFFDNLSCVLLLVLMSRITFLLQIQYYSCKSFLSILFCENFTKVLCCATIYEALSCLSQKAENHYDAPTFDGLFARCIFLSYSNSPQVSLPTTPSAVRPLAVWKLHTAV